MNIVGRIRASLRLAEAVRQAEEAHSRTGNRYYVMPVTGQRGKLIIMDRYNFRKLKHKGYISRSAKVMDLEMECFYCTASRGGGALPDFVVRQKRAMYYQWLNSTAAKKNGNLREH